MKKFILIYFLLIPQCSFAASYINSVSTTSTTAPTNMTGSTLYVAVVMSYFANACTAVTLGGTVTTWYPLVNYSNSAGVCIWYARAVGGSADTFSVSGSISSMAVFGFSEGGGGIDGTVVGATASSMTPQPGPITPSVSGDIVVAGCSGGGGGPALPTVDSGFLSPAIGGPNTGNNFTLGASYLIAPDTTTVNPTFTWAGAENDACTMIAFLPNKNPITYSRGFGYPGAKAGRAYWVTQ